MKRKGNILAVALLLLSLLTGCAGTGKGASGRLEEAREAAAAGKAPSLEALADYNSDIVGWLVIPGAGVSEAVLRSSDGDDAFYASHAADRTDSELGCVYSQAEYNAADFSDRVTVLYGSSAVAGKQFASLYKTYSEDSSLDRCGEITLYTPSSTFRYQAFAASLFNSTHLLHHYSGFQAKQDLDRFLQELESYHTLSRQLDKSAKVEDNDRVLILSTHVPQNEDLRFLVVAKLAEQAG